MLYPVFSVKNKQFIIIIIITLFFTLAPPRRAPPFLVCASGAVALKVAQVPSTALGSKNLFFHNGCVRP